MLVLPGPGLIVIAVGVILLGRHNPTLRRWAIAVRLRLRQLKRADHPLLRRCGRWLYMHHRTSRLLIHDQLQRHARGEPFAPLIRIWIGITMLIALLGLGLSVYMLIP
jgi:hypothetical protein